MINDLEPKMDNGETNKLHRSDMSVTLGIKNILAPSERNVWNSLIKLQLISFPSILDLNMGHKMIGNKYLQ